METINRKYIVDENNNKVAVQVDIKTFEKMEEIIENYGLFHLMKETENDKVMDMKSAKEYYAKLDKVK